LILFVASDGEALDQMHHRWRAVELVASRTVSARRPIPIQNLKTISGQARPRVCGLHIPVKYSGDLAHALEQHPNSIPTPASGSFCGSLIPGPRLDEPITPKNALTPRFKTANPCVFPVHDPEKWAPVSKKIMLEEEDGAR
jgi:hypothetical protein